MGFDLNASQSNEENGWSKLKSLLLYNSFLFFLFYLINVSLKDSEFTFNNVNDLRNRNYSLLYYTVNVQSTVAFGDIVPVSKLARFVFSLHVFLTMAGNAFIVFVL